MVDMATAKQDQKGLPRIMGFSLAVVLMTVLVGAGPAAAQCTGPEGNDNTACGTDALVSDGGADNSGFGSDTLESDTTGHDNTATGASALGNNNGDFNTASGSAALGSNGTGNDNTASGYQALLSNTSGDDNSAYGFDALENNSTGIDNTASGSGALENNTASGNTANGFNALTSNISGDDNTASGSEALLSNNTGGDNTASGSGALQSNTIGSDNTASGSEALTKNTRGGENTASGFRALQSNTTGGDNTASGFDALFNNTTGGKNIALGAEAGENLTTGSNNIDIGDEGVAGDANTIRIGTKSTQTKTFIAGISGTTVSGADVIVSSNGQLGVATSSARYKHDIRDIGNASDGLMKLRPVSFRYNNDPSKTVQYGLVAEEVERVYPELVTYGPDGKVQSVRYLELTAMLLNELQKQAARLRSKDAELAAQRRAWDQQQARLNALSERVAALERLSPAATERPVSARSLAQR
jgi:hypothetical protein